MKNQCLTSPGVPAHNGGLTFCGACGRREKQSLDRGHGASIVYTVQIHGGELVSLSVLFVFGGLRVVHGTRILRAAAVCSVPGPLSPLECSTPIAQIASKALHDANDALLGVHCITRITRPHFHCFSDPRFGALSPTKLWVHPLKRSFSTTTPPHTPSTHSFALKAQAWPIGWLS